MRIAFLGDIALIGQYDLTQNKNVKRKISLLAEKLKIYDYVIANLETPLTEIKGSLIPKSMHLKSPYSNVELLKYLNISAVTLANNHIYDFGTKGLEDTIDLLENHGIEWFGLNGKFLIKDIKGEKISLSGYCCLSTNGTGYSGSKNNNGINTLTLDNVINQLIVDRSYGALSILSIHWGMEHTNYPDYEHIQLANTIAMNKDVIIHGHHPHVVQGIQEIGNSLIAYSLGNCLFDDCISLNQRYTLKQNTENKKSFILDLNIENSEILKYEIHGFKDENSGFVFFDISNEIKAISQPLSNINNIDLYEQKRKEQVQQTIEKKFGKRNLKWLISRLNYYSIGARLTAIPRSFRYSKESKKFIDNQFVE